MGAANGPDETYRLATRGDQLEVLKWLMAKYPVQAAKMGAKEEK